MATSMRVPDLLRERAAALPAHVALLVDGGAALTYGDWDTRADVMAAGLAAIGLAAGDRVALRFDNARWTGYAVAYLATLRAGAVAVPLSPRHSAAEVDAIAEHAGAVLLVRPDDLHVGDLRGVSPAALQEGGHGAPAPPRAVTELAEIVYTSGTTGAARGVACTHASILAHDLPPQAADTQPVFAHAFPIGTNAGQECLRMPLRRPATAVVLPAFDPERLCALVARRRVERLQLVPAMAQIVVASGAAGRHDVRSVERVTLSSAPAPPALLAKVAEAFPGAAVFNAYALTEAGGARTLMRYDPARPTSVGRPVGDTELRLVDAAGDEVPAGQPGEVWLRRPGAPARSYYRDPAATAATFVGGWVRTGDIGLLDEDGRLHLVDRVKDLVNSGGASIATLEVEAVLAAHPAVADVAVFGLPHPVLGEQVAAAVVVRGDGDARALQAFARERLAEHKVPRRVHLVDALPRTATGKPLKRALRERYAAAPTTTAAAAARAAPANGVEQAVAAVWREVLGRADIGSDDDFFDLGGHSLGAAQVVARLQDRFHVELPVTAVFERPTVAELAGLVEDAVAGSR